jgi:hypothetical protein
MPAALWEWYLGRSSDLSIIHALPNAHSRSIKLALNDRESASFQLSLFDANAADVRPVSTCVLCYRNKNLVWSGPIWTVQNVMPNATMQIGCLGWFELLNHWLIHTGNLMPAGYQPPSGTMTSTTLSYTNIDQCAIIQSLMQLRADDAALNDNNAPLFVTAAPSAPNTGSNGVRTIVYNEYENLGQAITTMSQLEYGFDFRVDPTIRSRPLNMYFNPIWPLSGAASVNGRGQVRPNAVFGYRWGPANLATLTQTIDPSYLTNHVIAMGLFGSASAVDVGSQLQYGNFLTQASLSAVTQQAILQAYAGAEVAINSQPRVIYTFDQQPLSAESSVLQPFGVDFDIGDFCYLASNYGLIVPPGVAGGKQTDIAPSGTQPVRIFGYTVNISDEGVEQVQGIQTNFQSAT